MNRLTENQTKKANMLASMIDCSPHEWPNSSHEIQLICHGYLDRVADNQALRKRLAAVEAERDAARAASEKDREWVGRALEKQAEYLGQSQMLVAERDAARAGEARAVEALEKILVGGNHLASALTGMFEDRLPPYGTDFNEARRAFAGSDEYDMWVCWAVIMRVRDSLSDPQPALDWLAQQRLEAVAAWIEKEATKCRQQDGEYYERSVEGMLEEAAALRAGEVGNE